MEGNCLWARDDVDSQLFVNHKLRERKNVGGSALYEHKEQRNAVLTGVGSTYGKDSHLGGTSVVELNGTLG